MPSPDDKDKFFLDKSVFARPFFPRQEAELFSPEAVMLKEKLREVLLKSHSEENLDFINEIYDLNSKKDSPLVELKQGLQKIEDRYITINSENEINIEPYTLNRIRNSIDKTLLDYQTAVGDVIDLINANVSSQTKELVDIDKVILLNRTASFLYEELKKITQQPALKTSISFPKMFMKDENTLYNSFRTACEEAQTTFKVFAEDTKERNLIVKRKQFSSALIALVEKLSASFVDLSSYERAHPKADVRSSKIENLIDTISIADKRVNSSRTFTSRLALSPGTVLKTLDQDDSKSRTVSINTNSNSQTSESNTPVTTPRQSSRSMVLPPIKGTHFKHSSRAFVIEPKIEEEKEKTPTPPRSVRKS